MCLSGSMYVKWRNFICIKSTLYTAFTLDLVSAWKEFMARKLCSGETVDIYRIELWRLTVLFEGMSEKGLTCAFIAGMPESVEELLWASSQVDNMDISKVLAEAQAILKKGPMTVEQTVAAQPSQCQIKETHRLPATNVMSPITWSETASFGISSYRKRWETKILVLCYKKKTINGMRLWRQFFPKSPVNKVLPKVSVHIDRKKRKLLVDTALKPWCASFAVRCGKEKRFLCWEFSDMLWNEYGPNWYWQWALICCTNSGCR